MSSTFGVQRSNLDYAERKTQSKERVTNVEQLTAFAA